MKSDHPHYSDATARRAVYEVIDDKFKNSPKVPPEYTRAIFGLQNKVHTRLI